MIIVIPLISDYKLSNKNKMVTVSVELRALVNSMHTLFIAILYARQDTLVMLIKFNAHAHVRHLSPAIRL